MGFGEAAEVPLEIPSGSAMGPVHAWFVQSSCIKTVSIFTQGAFGTGHCQSNENANPPLPGTSYIHPSRGALCGHAYVVTKKSAARIVRLFRNPVYAYSRPIGELH